MLKRIHFPPGINHQSTQFAASGSWYDANNIRFKSGVAEMIGGWSRDETYTLQGIGRACFSNRDYSGNNYQYAATDWKVYAITGADATDITPVRSSGSLSTDPFAVLDGDSQIRVTHVSHGLAVNDWVVFTSATEGGGGVTTADLTQAHGFQVSTIFSADYYGFYAVDWTTGDPIVPSGSDISVGGSVNFSYKITSGLSAQVSGQGFGAGLWGGNGTPTSYDLASNPITVASASDEVTVEIDGTEPSSPAVIAVDDQLYLLGLTGTSVGGVNLEALNGHWWTVTDVSALGSDKVDIQIDQTGTGAVSGGGSGGSYYRGYNTGAETPVDPSVDGSSRGWNDNSELGTLTGDLRRVYLDNYGEDLIFCNSGGPFYYWDISANTSTGVPTGGEAFVAKEINGTNFSGTTGIPTVVDSFIVSKKDGHSIAFGCNDLGGTEMNSMLVRWSDQNNPFDWTPTPNNTSGGQVLRSGSRILGAVGTKDEVIIFTDSAVYSMRFVGPPDVFSFTLVSEGVEMVGARTAVNASNAVFFMGNDGFYVYTGSVAPLPCSVSSYVYDDFNFSDKDKAFGAVNSAFSEVSWFYPTYGSNEPNRFVTYNYEEQVWSYGSYDMEAFDRSGAASTSVYCRTSWRDAIIFSSPMATYLNSYTPSTETAPVLVESAVMVQESGASAQGSSLASYIESGSFDISDGENFSFVSRVVPDLEVFNVESDSGDPVLTMDIYERDLPGTASAVAATASKSMTFTVAAGTRGQNATYTPDANGTAIRARARSIAMRLSSSSTSYKWRAGDMRLDLRPDGRR
jgi:hypothetical protein